MISPAGTEAASMTESTLLDTSAGQIQVLTCGPADGEAVLLMHGCPSDATTWKWLFPALIYNKYRAIAIDMPGCGGSPGTKLSSRSEFNAAKGGPVDIACAVLDALGIAKAALVGYDWGGGIVLSMALRKKNRVSKLVSFHPSYTPPKGENLSAMSVPVLVLWVKEDQFHNLTKWRKHFEALPSGKRELESALPLWPSLALQTMPRASRPLVCLSLVAAGYMATQLAAFVAAPAAPKAPRTQLQARGGGEYDVSDADIESFYQSLLTGSGGEQSRCIVLWDVFDHEDIIPWTDDLGELLVRLPQHVFRPQLFSHSGMCLARSKPATATLISLLLGPLVAAVVSKRNMSGQQQLAKIPTENQTDSGQPTPEKNVSTRHWNSEGHIHCWRKHLWPSTLFLGTVVLGQKRTQWTSCFVSSTTTATPFITFFFLVCLATTAFITFFFFFLDDICPAPASLQVMQLVMGCELLAENSAAKKKHCL
ncbi:Bifunctional epoxide hydrolase 2 [Symbiodinium microadriaticum]|uniref:Bifunctional epoxide hydrolase 2 n=1 Tax=Symbiodinium microadriaticum TaxID=2951 RepID=A0A1Q9CY29_SYMMI|nr:Bifunctional epoxide hydrolase 2 [Symbiodinium microadriaticum]